MLFTKPDSNGTCYVKGINETYWATLYADENIVLHEPDERTFFHYDTETGASSVISPEAIKDVVSYRMPEVSRQDASMGLLENQRTERNLNAITSRLKGVVEHRHAFTDRPRAVYLANCILQLDGCEFKPCAFAPELRSRNRSPIILDGEPGRGKSQYGIALQALIGRENVTQLRTDHLNERFELLRFLMRTLFVGVDVDANFLGSKGAPVIKGLVGGDWFDAERKSGTGSFQFQGKFNILMTSNCHLKVKLQGDVGAC